MDPDIVWVEPIGTSLHLTIPSSPIEMDWECAVLVIRRNKMRMLEYLIEI
jgi:hypothetical protein